MHYKVHGNFCAKEAKSRVVIKIFNAKIKSPFEKFRRAFYFDIPYDMAGLIAVDASSLMLSFLLCS
jgi:hypothetical protein